MTLARNVRQLGHLDLAGAGQVTIANGHAFVGHLPNRDNLGTSILDISDPRKPRVIATVSLDDPHSHSHKIRVIGDLMLVNHERNMSRIGRRATASASRVPAPMISATSASIRELL